MNIFWWLLKSILIWLAQWGPCVVYVTEVNQNCDTKFALKEFLSFLWSVFELFGAFLYLWQTYTYLHSIVNISGLYYIPFSVSNHEVSTESLWRQKSIKAISIKLYQSICKFLSNFKMFFLWFSYHSIFMVNHWLNM